LPKFAKPQASFGESTRRPAARDMRSSVLNLRAAFGRLFFWSMCTFDVACWHFSDMAVGFGDVRYRGQSGSRILVPSGRLSTHKRHRRDRNPAVQRSLAVTEVCYPAVKRPKRSRRAMKLPHRRQFLHLAARALPRYQSCRKSRRRKPTSGSFDGWLCR
jgi:hypothetical protein